LVWAGRCHPGRARPPARRSRRAPPAGPSAAPRGCWPPRDNPPGRGAPAPVSSPAALQPSVRESGAATPPPAPGGTARNEAHPAGAETPTPPGTAPHTAAAPYSLSVQSPVALLLPSLLAVGRLAKITPK